MVGRAPLEFWAFSIYYKLFSFSIREIGLIYSLLAFYSCLYYDFGSLSVIWPRFLGHLIVYNKLSFVPSIYSKLSCRSSDIYFCKPGDERICSHDGLFLGVTYKQLLTIYYKSTEKDEGIGSKCPFVTFKLNPCILVALNGGRRVIIS